MKSTRIGDCDRHGLRPFGRDGLRTKRHAPAATGSAHRLLVRQLQLLCCRRNTVAQRQGADAARKRWLKAPGSRRCRCCPRACRGELLELWRWLQHLQSLLDSGLSGRLLGLCIDLPHGLPAVESFGDYCFLKRTQHRRSPAGSTAATRTTPKARTTVSTVRMTFNDRSDDGQMNQLYISMARAVKTDSCCWNIGGKIDMLYGTDARFTKAIGLETHDDGSDKWNSQTFYQISMPQALRRNRP